MRLRNGMVDVRPLRTSAAYRRLWVGISLSTMGSQLTVVAVLYQVWVLTGSPVAVGAVGLAQAVPSVVFGLLGGSLADAVDRRLLVSLTTMGQLVTAGMLAAQALAGAGSLWVVLAVVSLQEACGALGGPARRTFTVRVLPENQVGAGIALTHLSFSVSMLVGPAVAGVITAQWGVGVCYMVDALAFAVSLYSVLRLPTIRPIGGETGGPGLRAILAGLQFIGRTPTLGGALLTDALATVMAMPVALFPMINQQRFGGNPETLGLFLSVIAVGGIAAGAASGLITRCPRPGVVMLAAATVWGAGLAGFGLARPLWLGLGCLAVAGAADTISAISRGSVVQLGTPDSYRGRVSAVERIIGRSGPDLGNFRGGLVADVTSASFAAVSGGLICVIGCVAVAATNTSLRRFTISTEPSPASKPAHDADVTGAAESGIGAAGAVVEGHPKGSVAD